MRVNFFCAIHVSLCGDRRVLFTVIVSLKIYRARDRKRNDRISKCSCLSVTEVGVKVEKLSRKRAMSCINDVFPSAAFTRRKKKKEKKVALDRLIWKQGPVRSVITESRL